MQKRKRVFRFIWPLGFGAILLLVPLLRDLHLESAILISTVFCFWGSFKASKKSPSTDLELFAGLVIKVLLIAIPLFIHGLFANCLTWTDVGYWLLLPIPSILFGISIGRFFRILKFPAPRFLSTLMLLLVAVGILAYEFFTLPQVYYYNHVWGAWPGPIYDSEVQITAGLLWFRLSTILWVILLWLLPTVTTSRRDLMIVALSSILIITSLFVQPQLGISTPRSYLKSELPELIKTDHFHLYFSTSNFNEEERKYWAARHEFHFNQIVDVLEIDWPEGRIIESFIYENAWQKKELVGAKFTSYVPVWLEQDQMHIAKEHLEPVLKHELVHVITKQFGNELINASWSIGLIEGVAEAIAKDASDVSTLDQILAAENQLPTVGEMESSLSTFGFYKAASSISYTTAGSFVGYLLDSYPVENFKVAFPNSDFETAYQVPFDTLVTRWIAQLEISETDSLDSEVSQVIFSQRSLFQVDCPRKIHPISQGLDDLRYYESLSDTAGANSTLSDLNDQFPDVPLIKQLWANYQLRTENFELLNNSITESDSSLSLQLMNADALFSLKEFDGATSILSSLSSDTSFFGDENAQNSFTVRSDSLTWDVFVKARYHNKITSAETFSQLAEPLQWLLINRAMSSQSETELTEYARIMLTKSPNLNWIDTQESLINMLVYYGEFELAQQWIDVLQSLEMRDRFIERVSELQEWLDFNKTYQL